MAISVLIPTVLRKYTAGKEQVHVDGATVGDVIRALEINFHGITNGLYQENGELKPFINVYVNDEDIRFLNELDTAVSGNDTVTILPAIAGG
jgi:sulfur-carrier protein